MRGWLVLLALAATSCGSPTDPSSDALSGRWIGTYRLQQCVPVGWPDCAAPLAREPMAIELEATQNGSRLTGVLRIESFEVPVSGSIDGGILSLSGAALQPPISRLSSEAIAINQWSTTLGTDDTMVGTFHVERRTTWGPGASPYFPPFETWTFNEDAILLELRRN